jgi:hypothetical protein
MGFFFKALAAIVAADAIDRSARRPTRYWFPNRPGFPPPGSTIPYVIVDQASSATGRSRGRPAGWDPQPPERP